MYHYVLHPSGSVLQMNYVSQHIKANCIMQIDKKYLRQAFDTHTSIQREACNPLAFLMRIYPNTGWAEL
jgi:dsRNA-specific ribonuclease